MESLKISWTEFWSSIDIIALQAKQQHDIQSVLAIGRGGLIPGVFLSHKLGLPLAVIMAKGYKGMELQNEIIMTEVIGDLLFPTLIIDDILDSGSTIKAVVSKLECKDKCSIATIVTKQQQDNIISPIVVKKSQWIIFPYEK